MPCLTKYENGCQQKCPTVEASDWLRVSSFFFFFFSPGNLDWNESGKTKNIATRAGETLLLGSNNKADRCSLTELIRELLGSNPVHTPLAFSFVEGSALGANMFWRVLAKRTRIIRCWPAPGVKFGFGSGRLRFTERQQTGLADSSCWRNKIILILPTSWAF